MLNLASLRYARISAQDGGPIASVESAHTRVLGEPMYQANATLTDRCVVNRRPNHLYGNCDGSGTHRSPMVARHKAISEALERWAHYVVQSGPEGNEYGFDRDPSSNGMAAYPGMWCRQARPSALMEAAERFNVLSWWEGRLAAADTETEWPGVRAAVLISDAPGVTAIIYRTNGPGYTAYGHAAADTVAEASHRAAVEMERHEEVVRRYTQQNMIAGNLPAGAGLYERRSWFFAQPEGFELFQQRLGTPPRQRPLSFEITFDGPVPGPWQRYASVWRVAVDLPSDRFLTDGDEYFLW